MDKQELRSLVRSVLLRTLAIGESFGPEVRPQTRPALVTEADILAAAPGSRFPALPEARVTPLARQAALERHIAIEQPSANPEAKASAIKAIAIGADHGGYPLKENLKEYLRELGYRPVDCGTNSAEAVDYPDFAYAVAQMVADGRASRGIVVDGAGIGSCMAANKVPGVRAAMCYDLSTAVNSREHNDANVLTMGGGLIGANLARQIVKAWLDTPFAGGRHERRVKKIMDIEHRFLRR